MARTRSPHADRPERDHTVFVLVLVRLRWALAAIVALALGATVGYVAVEGYGWLDAFYMTVITLGTIGYGEVKPLHTDGRLLTIAVVIASFTTLVYAASILTTLFASGEAVRHLRERRSRQMLDAMEHHVIVVGFGRVGQAVVRGLQELGHPYVVIDRNPDHDASIQGMGAVQVVGDATDQSVLDRAGIARADALVAAADQDDANLVVVLTARAARPDLRIVCRVNEASWLERMRLAGADVAQSPYYSYGLSLAAAATAPGVLGLHHLPLLGLGTEEIELRADSPLVGMSIAAVGSTHAGIHVVGLRRENRLQRWEDVEGPLAAGDVVVALGTPTSLAELTAAVAGA